MNERPKCCNPKCENKSLLMIDGEFWCGECVSKLNEVRRVKNKEHMLEEING